MHKVALLCSFSVKKVEKCKKVARNIPKNFAMSYIYFTFAVEIE